MNDIRSNDVGGRREPAADEAQKRLVVVQRNPMSGSGRGRAELRRLVFELRARGFRVRMFGHRPALDEFIANPVNAADLRCLVVAGGDGTVTDLTNRHPGIPLALFPMGTENLLARYLKMPRNGQTIADVIQQYHVAALDSGLVNGHRFLLMLSSGVDADVVRRVHAMRKGHIGYHSYVLPLVSSFFGYRPSAIRVFNPESGRSAEGVHVIVTNVPAYGFDFRFSPDADPADGQLDVRVYAGPGRMDTLMHAAGVRLRCSWAERRVTRFRASEVVLQSVPSTSQIFSESGGAAMGAAVPRGAPVQCDGDPGPELPLTLKVDPKSLLVLTHGASHRP